MRRQRALCGGKTRCAWKRQRTGGMRCPRPPWPYPPAGPMDCRTCDGGGPCCAPPGGPLPQEGRPEPPPPALMAGRIAGLLGSAPSPSCARAAACGVSSSSSARLQRRECECVRSHQVGLRVRGACSASLVGGHELELSHQRHVLRLQRLQLLLDAGALRGALRPPRALRKRRAMSGQSGAERNHKRERNVPWRRESARARRCAAPRCRAPTSPARCGRPAPARALCAPPPPLSQPARQQPQRRPPPLPSPAPARAAGWTPPPPPAARPCAWPAQCWERAASARTNPSARCAALPQRNAPALQQRGFEHVQRHGPRRRHQRHARLALGLHGGGAGGAARPRRAPPRKRPPTPRARGKPTARCWTARIAERRACWL